jgi:uncharacterized SAM-binding protein YcdF (DUF218 family)
MQPGDLKPILTTLALPPMGPLLLALLGLWLATRRHRAGLWLAGGAIVLTLALSIQGVALLLARVLLPPVAAVEAGELQQVQAIVVLGGGVLPEAPEYGAPQLTASALMRLRYGVRLARQTGKPLAFAGGLGWASEADATPEAVVAQRVLQQDYGMALRWREDRSRDTAENAQRLAELTRVDGVRRIALVTDAIHMPRAAAAFRRAGFEVVPAPTVFPVRQSSPVLEWLPTAEGLVTSRYLIREWLGRQVAGG